MFRRRLAALCALVVIGGIANGQEPLVDHQVVPIEQDGEPQEVGPISLLGLDIPEGFPVELFLDVTHAVEKGKKKNRNKKKLWIKLKIT